MSNSKLLSNCLVGKYTCKICSFSCQSLKVFTTHVVLHKNLPNFSFPCGVVGCKYTFHKYETFKSHVYRYHITDMKQSTNNLIQLSLTCSTILCKFTCNNFPDYVAHLKAHIKNGLSVSCPFGNCTRNFTVISSFSSHLSRVHRQWKPCDISSSVLFMPDTQESDTQSVDSSFVADCSTVSATIASEITDINLDEPPKVMDMVDITANDYGNALALFYLKMQAQFLLPATVIQEIITNFQNVHDLGQIVISTKLTQHLQSLEIEDKTIESIMLELKKNDMLHIFNTGILRSHKSRQSYFKSEFGVVAPSDVYLGQDANGKAAFYEYVPIKETLLSLFRHDFIVKQYNDVRQCNSRANCLSDICDGHVFKANSLFATSDSALRIILYQDSFEVVNPLGSGKKSTKCWLCI